MALQFIREADGGTVTYTGKSLPFGTVFTGCESDVFHDAYVTFDADMLKDHAGAPITGATLRMQLTGYWSTDPSHTVQLHDVSAAGWVPANPGPGTYADLETGELYGAATFTKADLGPAYKEVTLSQAALDDLRAAILQHNDFSIGLVDLNGEGINANASGVDGLSFGSALASRNFELQVKFADPYATQTADNLAGTADPDFLAGLGGNDTITAYAGNDTLFGNGGADLLYGNTGADTIYGGQDNDTVYGGQDGDTVEGNFGSDVLYGNFGNDFLHGGQGSDVLYGGQDADTLNGGLGDDVLVGGLGGDLFVFAAASGHDTVVDFSFAQGDRLHLDASSYTVSETAGCTAIFCADGSTITLQGVSLGELQPGFLV